jgi:hypothetical protein
VSQSTALFTKKHRLLRFGIMCNGTSFRSWEALCLQKLLVLENVEPALLIMNDSPVTASGNWKKLWKLSQIKYLRVLFWYVYDYLIVNRRSKANQPVDMTSTLSQLPSIKCKVMRKGRFSQYFSEPDIAQIRKYDLDFILRFGFNIIRGEILKAASFGVWSFHHDDEEKYRGGPPCFWEIYNGDHVTGAILQRLTDRLDSGIILKKGFFQTINTSYVRNRDAVWVDSAEWPAQVCIDIQNGNDDYLYASPSLTSSHIFCIPNNLQMVLFLLKISKNFIQKLYKSLFCDQWNIGIVNAPIHVFLKSAARPQVQWLPEPARKRFFADPFAVCQDNVVNILFEDYDYRTSKGCISAASFVSGKLEFTPKVVINTPFHMSYPYLFEYNNQIYCVPETSENREVCLYKAKEFPRSWVRVATLISNFAGVDSTIFQFDNRWWLLAMDASDGPYHKLKVWHATDLLGPWESHMSNPVKVDIRSARPAGTPFMYDGHLYRPSQDCSETYGGKVIINRVIRLTPTEFKEEQLTSVNPYENSPYSDGLHTISAAGSITLIDGKKAVFIGRNLSMLINNLTYCYSRLRKN